MGEMCGESFGIVFGDKDGAWSGDFEEFSSRRLFFFSILSSLSGSFLFRLVDEQELVFSLSLFLKDS